jgi:hypothetical protein
MVKLAFLRVDKIDKCVCWEETKSDAASKKQTANLRIDKRGRNQTDCSIESFTSIRSKIIDSEQSQSHSRPDKGAKRADSIDGKSSEVITYLVLLRSLRFFTILLFRLALPLREQQASWSYSSILSFVFITLR